MDGMFDALGDATRRRILVTLAGGEQTAGAVVEAVQAQTSISQPAVSQHLKALRAAGLVEVRAEGTRRLYRIDEQGIDAARAWLAHLLDPTLHLAQPLDALATEVARGKRSRRAAPNDATTTPGAGQPGAGQPGAGHPDDRTA